MTENLPDTNVGNIGYIRREDVKNLRFSDGINHDGFLYVPYKELVDGIKALPSADVVQVVHAYWIQTSAEDEDGNAYYSCSNCGSGESHNPIVEVPYCWKCGAKMDAQGEE